VSGASPARRKNRALLSVLVTVGLVVGAAAFFGSRRGAEEVPESTTTTVRRAEPGEPWFSAATADDPAYPMISLSCEAMDEQVSVELCRVFGGPGGEFMVAASEAFWDPAEPDFDGTVRVPLVIGIYVLAGSGFDSAAEPVLVGIVAAPFGDDLHEVALYSSPDGDGESAVVVWTSRESLRGEAREDAQRIRFDGPGPEAEPIVVGDLVLDPAGNYVFPRPRTGA